MGHAGVTEDYIKAQPTHQLASSSPIPGGAHITACVVPGFVLPNLLACQLAHIHIQKLPGALVKTAQVSMGQVEGKQEASEVKLEEDRESLERELQTPSPWEIPSLEQAPAIRFVRVPEGPHFL